MYHGGINQFLIDMITMNAMNRLQELRGGRTFREIADAIGVTPQAVQKWEKTGHVSRKHAEAYDAALGAGGEVLSLLGYADVGGVTLATIDRKLDLLLELARGLRNNRQGRHRNEVDPTPIAAPRPALKGRR